MRDDAILGLVPAAVHLGGHHDHAGLVERGMVVDDIGLDAVVGAEGVAARILGPAHGQVSLVRHPVGPEGLFANAHVGPTLDGAPQARSIVFLPRPLVEAPGHLVEHAWTHANGLTRELVLVVDGRRQGKTGTGPFAVLVEDLLVPRGHHRPAQLAQGGLVEPVPQVRDIGGGIGLPSKLWHEDDP